VKITNVEVLPITMPLAERYGEHDGPIRMYDMDQHVLVKVHSDNGIVGYGSSEDHSTFPEGQAESVVDRDPFDFIQNDLHIALGAALYDVMGKHLEVPAWKLMGQKVRDRAQVAAWTRPCSAPVFKEEVRRAAAQGHLVFKMHTSPLYDVFEQTKAAEEVAPPGFKLHWDMNHNRTMGAVMPVVLELQKSPIVGFIEDPLPWDDIDGWRRLREKMTVPLVMHAPRLGGLQEVIHGVADVHMIGTSSVGQSLRKGFAYGETNTQVILQHSGNTVAQAMTLHLAAVLPTASAHVITLADQYDEDITTTRIPVIEGVAEVPDGPGLGVEIDEKALAAALERTPIERARYIGIVLLPGGNRMFCADRTRQSLYGPNVHNIERLTGREEGVIRGVNYERWIDDGSADFETTYERLQTEGAFVATGEGA
jgi:L-alanine-DL-glutamate epimerase-like enolase superfamily enzyme